MSAKIYSFNGRPGLRYAVFRFTWRAQILTPGQAGLAIGRSRCCGPGYAGTERPAASGEAAGYG